LEILPNNNIIGNGQDPAIAQKKMENLIKENAEDNKLKEVCKEFESIFLYMMFKEMKNTIPESGIIEKSQGTKVFEEMYLEELSKEITKGDNGIGIAEMMYQQFKKGYVSW
jgi:flagellar protein FlgJ